MVGAAASRLFSLNGLTWPVATDGNRIQIGCQLHTVEKWQAFDDTAIAAMAREALNFWKAHKALILTVAATRKELTK